MTMLAEKVIRGREARKGYGGKYQNIYMYENVMKPRIMYN